MEGTSAKKSISLETLVIQNITNVKELKAKLNDIIKTGKDYDYDVSSCIKSLISSSDQEIVFLSVQAIAELSKCEDKRESYAHKDTIEPLLSILSKEITSERLDLVKQACRALGNLCCDCDTGRKVIMEKHGVPILVSLLQKTLDGNLEELKLFANKIFLNFTIGGKEMCEAVLEAGLVEVLNKILISEVSKEAMNDSLVSTTVNVLSVINDYLPEHLFSDELNVSVLNILKEATNVEISELCIELLHMQVEHDSVKMLLANHGGVELVCSRLEILVGRRAVGDLTTEDAEVEAIMKQACDLIVIVLTGDEAMHRLYNAGRGPVYLTTVKWLDSTDFNLLTTAVLAVGNFARQDDYCVQMMERRVFDKLLDIFELYHGYAQLLEKEGTPPVDLSTATRIQHAAVSAIRNLAVPAANKRTVAAAGRAAPILLKALPSVRPQHVAYKLLAAIRMLVQGQESVARLTASSSAALAAISRWGAAEYPGPAGEAPRLLALCVTELRAGEHLRLILQVDGCVACLVNMLVASHSVMQNEAILSLTLLAVEALQPTTPTDYNYENSFISQLIKSEIGKHISLLIGTNSAKMPLEVAENLLALLEITTKRSEIVTDYKQAKVDEALGKFLESRKDFTEIMLAVMSSIVTVIVEKE